MPTALHVYIRDKDAAEDDPISVEHVFYGRTEAEADKKRLAHLAGCENFAKAEADGRTTESVESITAHLVPTWAMVNEDSETEEEDDEDEDEVIDVPGGPVDPEDE